MLDFIDLVIDWTVDFVEFLWLPIVLGILYLFEKRYRRNKYNRHRQTHHVRYSQQQPQHYHNPGNEPDFNYMNHDDSDEPNRKDYRTESYGYGDQISPFERDDQGAYQQMDEYNKNQ